MHVYKNAVENNDMIFKIWFLKSNKVYLAPQSVPQWKNSGCTSVLDCNFSCDWGFV